MFLAGAWTRNHTRRLLRTLVGDVDEHLAENGPWKWFLTMLMHAAINNTAGIVASPASVTIPFSLRTTLTAWLTAVLLWLCAGYFLVQMRGVMTSQAPGGVSGFDVTTGEACNGAN